MRKTIRFAILTVLLTAAALTPASADTIFTVTLDTTTLTVPPGSTAGPFSLAFQLTDGSGLGDANNTATVSGFQFGGGSASACPAGCSAIGGAGGDAGSSIVLNDSSFFNSFVEAFTPGTSLSFHVDLTTSVDPGGTPDAFAFSLLDGGGFPIPTLDPSGADTLLNVNLDSTHPRILAYATDVSRLTGGGSGVAISIPAPEIGAPSSAVPEPNALLSIAISVAGLALIVRKRSRQ